MVEKKDTIIVEMIMTVLGLGQPLALEWFTAQIRY